MPRALPAGFLAEAGGVGVGGLGFSVQETVVVVLGQRNLFQVHLHRGPEVREGIPDIQSLWDPRNAKPGAGWLAGFGSPILQRGGLATPLPSFCFPTEKKEGGGPHQGKSRGALAGTTTNGSAEILCRCGPAPGEPRQE